MRHAKLQLRVVQFGEEDDEFEFGDDAEAHDSQLESDAEACAGLYVWRRWNARLHLIRGDAVMAGTMGWLAASRALWLMVTTTLDLAYACNE